MYWTCERDQVTVRRPLGGESTKAGRGELTQAAPIGFHDEQCSSAS